MSIFLLRRLNCSKNPSTFAVVQNANNVTQHLFNDSSKEASILNNCNGTTFSEIHTATSPLCYSRKSDSEKLNSSFKVVKRVRVEDKAKSFFPGEGGPNWEILAPRNHRFYFPNNVGPAWTNAGSTVTFEAPLEALVNLKGEDNEKNKLLELSVGECPSLLKKSLHELFPAPEVVNSEKLALMTLRFEGENEEGARKFVLAAREITARLRLHGYWADFMNPFSGKPFYSWANGKNLYKIDDRFRGLNMKLDRQAQCTIISSEENEKIFSGAIYTTAPCNHSKIISLLEEQV